MEKESPQPPEHPHLRPYEEVWRRYRHYAAQQDFRVSVLFSVVLFASSVFVSFLAIQYATESASNPVTDIILSNIPAFDVDALFVYGTVLLIAFIVFLLLINPKRIPFTVNALTLFFYIRSAFTSLTHVGPFATLAPNADWSTLTRDFLFGSDLFFSAHTGVPFLMALIFWKDKTLRYIFLAWSVYLGVIVLLGHYHYSIDVASAFFITYTIYKIAEWLLPKDRALFYSDMPEEIR